MDNVIFIILSVIYLLLGLISITNLKFKNLGLKWFVILTVLLPITKITTPFHFKYQVSVYYFFFIGVIIIFLKKSILKKRVFEGILFILIFVLFYFIQLIFTNNEHKSFINILKDVKPFIIMILAYLFVDYYSKQISNLLSEKFINNLILFNFIFSSLFFYFMNKMNLHLILTDDPYFKYEELRYETLGTYFGLFFLMFSIFNNKKISLKNIILIAITTMYSGNRTLILTIVFLIIIYFLTKVSLNKIVIFITTISIFLISTYYLIINSSDNSPLFRFKKMLSIDYIEYALLNRFSPFIISIKAFNFTDFIFGKGFGYGFFIPWFVWRKNIDNYNIYIDNLYLTLYAKYGVFFILIFLMLFYYLKIFSNKNTYIFYFLFILVLSITNAMIYQFNFLWLLIIFTLPFYNSKKNII